MCLYLGSGRVLRTVSYITPISSSMRTINYWGVVSASKCLIEITYILNITTLHGC